MKQWLNIRTVLFLIAAAIISGTVLYSSYLTKKIAANEDERMKIWLEAQRTLIISSENTSLTLAATISSENKDIPIIETNEKDSITQGYNNLDSNKVKADSNYLRKKLSAFKRQHKPLVLTVSTQPLLINKYYYGESLLQQEVRYYPIVQLLIVSVFLATTILSQRSAYISTQNQLWAGMAKETAHQLGTPLSSLKGWIEVLKDVPGNEMMTCEIEKDVNRLELISDRFGKIGSAPKLEEKNIIPQIAFMIDYIKKRAGGKVEFVLNTFNQSVVSAMISPPLFDWVIENLLKNALDAMDGHGAIKVTVKNDATHVLIDVADTGKGISKHNISKIFNPGFTTKKRGWGLGLTLSKRIIDQYHKGSLTVKQSELNKGTTFEILLNK